jgi:hypothetical protein
VRYNPPGLFRSQLTGVEPVFNLLMLFVFPVDAIGIDFLFAPRLPQLVLVFVILLRATSDPNRTGIAYSVRVLGGAP